MHEKITQNYIAMLTPNENQAIKAHTVRNIVISSKLRMQ